MLTVKIATTSADIELALRLRYSVYFSEYGDARYADHEQHFWIDDDDGPHSHLFVALNDSHRVIGTARLTILREWEFIGLPAFQLAALASHLGMPLLNLKSRLARVDRTVVAKDFRRSGIWRTLMGVAEQTAVLSQCDVLVAAIALDNLPSRQAFLNSGWLEYPAVGTHGGFTGQGVFKVLTPKTNKVQSRCD